MRVVISEPHEFAGSYPSGTGTLGDYSLLYRYFGVRSPKELVDLMSNGDPFADKIITTFVALRRSGKNVTVQQVADMEQGAITVVPEQGDDAPEASESEPADPTTPSARSGGGRSTAAKSHKR